MNNPSEKNWEGLSPEGQEFMKKFASDIEQFVKLPPEKQAMALEFTKEHDLIILGELIKKKLLEDF